MGETVSKDTLHPSLWTPENPVHVALDALDHYAETLAYHGSRDGDEDQHETGNYLMDQVIVLRRHLGIRRAA